MSDIQKSVLLKIDIDNADGERRIVNLREQMAKLREEQDKNSRSNKELEAQYIATEQIIKALGSEIKKTENVLKAQAQAAISNEGSFNQLQNQWKAAEAQLKALSGTIKKNEDGTISLTKEYTDQSAEVDRLKQALLLFNAGIAQGNLNVGNYGNSLEGMRQKLKDLGVIMQNSDFGSKAFMDAKEEAEKLNRVIANTSKDGFDAFTEATNLLTGAMGFAMLAAGDNEEAQEKLRKVMGALAIAQTTLTIARQKDDIMQTAQLIKTKAATGAQALYTTVVGTSTGALKAFRLALAATGIGAIVLVLYEAAKAFGVFGGAADDAAEAQERVNEQLREGQELESKWADTLARVSPELQRQYDLRKAQGASEAELYDLKKKMINSEIENIDLALKTNATVEKKIELDQRKLDLLNDLKVADADYTAQANENAKKRADELEKESERVNKAIVDQMNETQKVLDQNKDAAWAYYYALNAAIAAAVADSQKQFDAMGEEITDTADDTANLIFESFKTNRDKQKEESEQMMEEWLSYANSTADALASVLGNAIGGSYESVKDFQRDLLKVSLTALKNAFQLALAQGAFKEIATKGIAGILTSAITTIAVETAYSAALAGIEGFATGGKIKGGTPIQRSNGDDVLITAKRGEVILNDGQQRRLERMGGRDVWSRLGVPGFADGGFVPRQIAGEAAYNVNMSAMRDLQDVIRSMPAPVLQYREFAQFENSVRMADKVSGL